VHTFHPECWLAGIPHEADGASEQIGGTADMVIMAFGNIVSAFAQWRYIYLDYA